MTPLAAFAAVSAVTGVFFGLAHLAARQYGIALHYRTTAAGLALGAALAAQILLLNHDFVQPRLVVIVAAGGASALSDASTGYIFDLVTLPALAAILIIARVQHDFIPAVTGAVAAGGALFVLFAVTRGRGLGLGDVKLACCIGAALGAYDGLLALGFSFVLGGSRAAYLLISRRAARGHEMHFGPYLATGMAALALVRMVW